MSKKEDCNCPKCTFFRALKEQLDKRAAAMNEMEDSDDNMFMQTLVIPGIPDLKSEEPEKLIAEIVAGGIPLEHATKFVKTIKDSFERGVYSERVWMQKFFEPAIEEMLRGYTESMENQMMGADPIVDDVPEPTPVELTPEEIKAKKPTSTFVHSSTQYH